MLVRAIGGNRVVDIDDAHDLSKQGNRVAFQPVRVSRSIEPFVMMAYDWSDLTKRAKLAAEPIADDRMILDALVLGNGQSVSF